MSVPSRICCAVNVRGTDVPAWPICSSENGNHGLVRWAPHKTPYVPKAFGRTRNETLALASMQMKTTAQLRVDDGGTRRRSRIEDESGWVLDEASFGPARGRLAPA